MYYKHGPYPHAANTVKVSTFAMTRQFSERGRVSQVNTMTLDGVLIADSQSELRLAIMKLENAYLNTSVETSGFHHDNHSTTPHYLRSKGSFGGIRVRELSYPSGEGAEYATQRTFRIVLSVETPPAFPGMDQPEDEVVTEAFTETVTISGGHKRVLALSLLSGGPEFQSMGDTAMKAVQQGSMTTQGGYGTPPGALYGREHMTNSSFSNSSPTFDPQIKMIKNYGITWSYTFIGADLKLFRPNVI